MVKSSGWRASGRQVTEPEAKEDLKQEAAQDDLVNYLGRQFVQGKMAATDICVLAYFLSKCGLDKFTQLALCPEGWERERNSNASKLCSTFYGLPRLETELLHIPLPVVSKLAGEQRRLEPKPIEWLPSLLFEEFCLNPDDILRSTRDLQIPNWIQNPARLEAVRLGYVPVPYGLFVDGAAFAGKGAGTRQSLIAYYTNIIGQRRRRTLFLIRKDSLCPCPCRGRCTLDTVDRFLAFSAASACAGMCPPKDHLNQDWATPSMRSLVGKPFTFKQRRLVFICIELRQDWDQLSAGMGMPYSNQRFFCWCCPCENKSKYKSVLNQPVHNHETYMAEINSCRIAIRVAQADADAIFNLLVFDTRVDKSMRGRVLCRPIAVRDVVSGILIELLKWDRLELDGSVWDIHCRSDELCGAAPFSLVFFRRSPYNNLMGWSWLLRLPGVRFSHIMIGDLHALDLGVTPRLLGNVFARVLRDGTVFGNDRSLTGVQQGCAALTATMRSFFKGSRRKAPHRITVKSLGLHLKTSPGHLKCKGAQARALLPFALNLLSPPVAASIVGGNSLRKACLSLMRAYDLMDTSPRCNFDSARLTYLLNAVRYYALKASVPPIPKLHLVQHMGHLAELAGNPKFFSEYLDESHNRVVVKLAQVSSTVEFAARVLARERLSYQFLKAGWRASD